MSPQTERSALPPVLSGMNALVVGVANDRSIAWGCAQAMRLAGAEIAMTYVNDKALPHVEPLAREVGARLLLPLEVRDEGQVDALFEAIGQNWGASTYWCIRSRSRRARRWRDGSPIVRATGS